MIQNSFLDCFMKGSELMNNDLKFLNTKEVAAALNCSLPTARQIMMRADFPLIRTGRAFKVNEQAFLDWARKRRVQC